MQAVFNVGVELLNATYEVSAITCSEKVVDAAGTSGYLARLARTVNV